MLKENSNSFTAPSFLITQVQLRGLVLHPVSRIFLLEKGRGAGCLGSQGYKLGGCLGGAKQHLEVKVLASNRVPVPFMFSVIQRNL